MGTTGSHFLCLILLTVWSMADANLTAISTETTSTAALVPTTSPSTASIIYSTPPIERLQNFTLYQNSSTASSVFISWQRQLASSSINFSVSCPPETGRILFSTESLFFNCTGLTAGGQYNVSIVAKASGYLDSYAQWILAKTLVSPVRNVSVTNTSETCIEANWSASSTNGAIYYLECANSFTINCATNHSGRICGLQSGISYNLSVTVGKYGFSNSTPSDFVIAQTLLSPVSNLTATSITDTCITLQWSSSVTSNAFYYLNCFLCNRTISNPIHSSSQEVCNLKSGEEYEFQVTTGKTGFPNSSSTARKVKTLLSKVAYVSTSSYNETCISAQWPPSNAADVTYNLTCGNKSVQLETRLNGTCCGLQSGENYNVSVAVNKVAFEQSAVTYARGQTLVSPVSNVTAQSSTEDSCVSATWSQSQTAGVLYYLKSLGAQIMNTSNSTSGKLCGLESGQLFRLVVIVGKHGFANSTQSSGTEAKTLVSPVENVTAKSYNETCFNVTWAASKTSNVIYYLTCGISQFTLHSLTGLCCGLTPGETYDVSVQVGKESFSNSTVKRIEQQTQLPSVDESSMMWNVTSTSIAISWQPPSSTAELQYQVCLNNTIYNTTSPDLRRKISNLTAGTIYHIQVSVFKLGFPNSRPTAKTFLTRPANLVETALIVNYQPTNQFVLSYNKLTNDSGTDGLTIEVYSARRNKSKILEFNLTSVQAESYNKSGFLPTFLHSDNLTVRVTSFAAKSGMLSLSEYFTTSLLLTDPLPPLVACKVEWNKIVVNLTTQSPSTKVLVLLQLLQDTKHRKNCSKQSELNFSCSFDFINLQPSTNYTIEAWAEYFGQKSFPAIVFSKTSMLDSETPVVVIWVSIGCVLILLVAALLVVLFTHKRRRDAEKQHRVNQWAAKPATEIEIPIVMQASWMSDGPTRDISIEDFREYVTFLLRDSELEVQRQFEELREASKQREQELYTFKSALADCNQAKNRYVDILPYDHTRVMLEPINEGLGSEPDDYINANYIKGLNREREFIACQGPLPGTLVHHWRMIYEHKVALIVTLTPCMDGPKPKCEPFWPLEVGKCESYDDIKVLLESESTLDTYLVRKMQATCATDRNQMEPLEVVQLYYFGWPDHGVPNIDDLAEFLKIMRKYATPPKSSDCEPPILVHCSAGVGRTGTLIVLDILTRSLEQRLITSINVYDTVMELRSCRKLMVQTKGQLAFIYRFLLHYLDKNGLIIKGSEVQEKDSSIFSGTFNPGFYLSEAV